MSAANDNTADEVRGDGFHLLRTDALHALRMLAVNAERGAPMALVCDPPYASGGFSEAGKMKAAGQGLRSETIRRDGWFSGDQMSSAGLAWLLRACAVAFVEVAPPGSTLSMFCDWRMTPTLAPAIESAGIRLQNLLVWDKGHAGLGTGFRAQHECILHFAMGTPRYASASHGNVLRAPRMPSARQHPTEKPVALMRAIVETVAPVGGLIVDPFMGSGSTGVAALELGRRFYGSERDPHHFHTALTRLERARRAPQLDLAPAQQLDLIGDANV